ncbi:hypothetical protein ACLB2K_066020 [Fragaria x ananassa]
MDENGRVIRRRWVCSKEGKSPGQTGKKKGQDVNLQAKAWEKRSRRGLVSRGVRYTIVGYPVEFAVRYYSEKGMYRVRHFVHKHSHELAQPNEVHFLRSNRNIEDRDVAQVQWLCGAQVHTSRAFEKLVEQVGGRDVVGFTVKDLYNKMDKLRKKSHTDGDAQAAMTWMNMRGIYFELFCCRLYAWHIGRNIEQNVKDHVAQKSFGKMIYVSMSVTEWEAEWHSLVARDGLVDNVWVTDLFNRRERWAEAFFRGHFYGGMCSMQRVEGMHSKLKSNLDRYTLISEMMPRMERSVSHIRDWILFKKQFVIVHRAPFPLTDTVVFYIAQYNKPHRRWSAEFQSHETNPLISCSCKQFESDGIPCCHIFYVMKDQLVCRYPKSLEKERWKKSVGDSTMESCFKVPVDNKAAQVARVGVNKLARLVQSSIEFKVNPSAVDASNLPPSNIVRDPHIARTKGMHDNEELVKLPEDVAALQNSEEEGSHDDDAGEKLAEMYNQLQMMGPNATEAQASKILAGLGFTKDMQGRPTLSNNGERWKECKVCVD